MFPYGNVSLDKLKALVMVPSGVAAINIDGATYVLPSIYLLINLEKDYHL